MWYNLVYPTSNLTLTQAAVTIIGETCKYDGRDHAIVELNTIDELNSLINCLKAEIPDCIGIFCDGRTITPKIEGDYT